MSFEKVVNRLNNIKAEGVSFNLASDSSEQEIISSIASMENRINALNAENKDAQNKIKVANESQTDLMAKLKEAESKAKDSADAAAADKAAYDKMKAQCENMEADNKILKEKVANAEKDQKEAADKVLKEKAHNLVKKHDEAGKFAYANAEEKKKVINAWEDKAFNDYDGTELILDAIPVRLKSPVVNFEPSADDKRPDMKDGSAANYVKENQERRAARAKQFAATSTQ